jgi:hypothetical protein
VQVSGVISPGRLACLSGHSWVRGMAAGRSATVLASSATRRVGGVHERELVVDAPSARAGILFALLERDELELDERSAHDG